MRSGSEPCLSLLVGLLLLGFGVLVSAAGGVVGPSSDIRGRPAKARGADSL